MVMAFANCQRHLAAMVVIVVSLVGRTLCACGPSQGNCFAPVTNRAPAAAALANETCGLPVTDTYSFGGLVSSSGIPRQTGLVCDAAVMAQPARFLNDGDNTTWWQAPYATQDVSVQLDWNRSILLSSITLVTRSIPARALRLDYSTNSGASWSTYQYFSTDCLGSFGFAETPAAAIPSDTSPVCVSRDVQVFGGRQEDFFMIHFNPTSRLGEHRFSNVSLIQNYLVITNLRVVFQGLNLYSLPATSQPNFGRSSPGAESYYHALYEWNVAGSCHCFGHAGSCIARPGDNPSFPTGCNCSHNTMGENCQMCQPLYNNRTWGPGTDTAANECQMCDCNNHTDVCEYNPTQASGVCVQCRYNTRGVNCEQCAEGYYRNATLPFTHPSSCIPCACSTPYTVGRSVACNQTTGQCQCHAGVGGRTCDECRIGFHSLAVDSGCTACQCDVDGTIANRTCNVSTGHCPCKGNVEGINCDRCKRGFYGPSFIAPLDGCYQCVCSGKTDNCSSATGYRLSTIVSDFTPGQDIHGWTFRSATGSLLVAFQTFIPVNPTFLPAFQARIDFEDSASVFVAPQSMVQGLRFALGHRFIFGLQTRPFTPGAKLNSNRPVGDVLISSNHTRIRRLAAVLDSPPVNNVAFQHTMLLHPGQWHVGNTTGPVATLQDIIAALNHATELTIRAVYFSNIQGEKTETNLYGVSLETSIVSSNTSLPETRNIPQCNCPLGYTTDDCSQCTSPLYSRNYDLRGLSVPVEIDQFDNCTACACNGHSAVCDERTGVCQGCADNTIGDHCELCNDTFYGDATDATRGCSPCQCNNTGSLNNVCNKTTGQCGCVRNVLGRQCDRCQSGTYNFSVSGCRACGCNVPGVSAAMCANGDCNCGQVGASLGVCTCIRHVTGDKCTSCAFGTQGSVPNCEVCHPCFDAWLVIIGNLRTQISLENNRTLVTLQQAFGSMSAQDISITLGSLQDQLSSVRGLQSSRREAELDMLLDQVESNTSQLMATLAALAASILQSEGNINTSATNLPSLLSFNGSIEIGGTLVSSASLQNDTREQEIIVEELRANFTVEQGRLQDTVQEILNVTGDVNASRAIATSAQATAQVALATSVESAAAHTSFEVSNRNSIAEIQRLDASIRILEEDLANSSRLLSAAAGVALIANATAQQARIAASAQLTQAQQLLSNTSRLSALLTTAQNDASNASGIVTELLNTARQTSSTAQSTLREAEVVNTNLASALGRLQQAEQAAQSALAIQLPSISTITDISMQINSTIIPEATVNSTLDDARRSLRESEQILRVAQSAYNMSTLALQTVSGIESALATHSAQHALATQALSRAQALVQQTNTSLQVARMVAEQLTASISASSADLSEVEDLLPEIASCQENVTAAVASLLGTAQQSCASLKTTTNQTVTTAEELASSVQGNASQQLSEAQQSQRQAQSVSTVADQVSQEVADTASVATLQDLLSRYITATSRLETAQQRANSLQTQLDAIITDLNTVSASCPATSSMP